MIIPMLLALAVAGAPCPTPVVEGPGTPAVPAAFVPAIPARLPIAGPAPVAAAASDSADVAAAVARFHEALAAGDSAAALALLAPHVVILESGGVEGLADYRAHHLPADIEFARAVPSVRAATTVRVRGDVAWASGTSATQGQFRGRAVNSSGAELMVLERTAQGWRIAAIHWSSRARRG